jgi:hypothetical protein
MNNGGKNLQSPYYHDLDWIRLKNAPVETWYDRRVWCLIDNAFDDIGSIQVLR